MFQKLLLCLFTYAVLSACAAAPVQTTDVPAQTPATAIPGTGQVRGQLLTSEGQPLANRTVRLATVYGTGSELAYVADESGGIGGVTDASGGFAISGVPVGRYVILLVVREGISIALLQPDGKEKIIEVTADKLVDIGAAKIKMRN